eukprot:2959268-Prymnesium_polylepis.1
MADDRGQREPFQVGFSSHQVPHLKTHLYQIQQVVPVHWSQRRRHPQARSPVLASDTEVGVRRRADPMLRLVVVLRCGGNAADNLPGSYLSRLDGYGQAPPLTAQAPSPWVSRATPPPPPLWLSPRRVAESRAARAARRS